MAHLEGAATQAAWRRGGMRGGCEWGTVAHEHVQGGHDAAEVGGGGSERGADARFSGEERPS